MDDPDLAVLVMRALRLAHESNGPWVLWIFPDGGWRPRFSQEDDFRPAIEEAKKRGWLEYASQVATAKFHQPAEASGGPLLLRMTANGRGLFKSTTKPIA